MRLAYFIAMARLLLAYTPSPTVFPSSVSERAWAWLAVTCKELAVTTYDPVHAMARGAVEKYARVARLLED